MNSNEWVVNLTERVGENNNVEDVLFDWLESVIKDYINQVKIIINERRVKNNSYSILAIISELDKKYKSTIRKSGKKYEIINQVDAKGDLFLRSFKEIVGEKAFSELKMRDKFNVFEGIEVDTCEDI